MEGPPHVANSLLSKAGEAEPFERPPRDSRWPADADRTEGPGVDRRGCIPNRSHRDGFTSSTTGDQVVRRTRGYRVWAGHFSRQESKHVAANDRGYLSGLERPPHSPDECLQQLPAFLR